jgi:DUF971 family protein
MTFKPREIKASRKQGLLTIVWEDGHRSEYRFVDLRAACPCAECQGTHAENSEADGSLDLNLPLRSERATQLEALEQVGNYALQITWQDGHRFGIYTWDYLRSLCPCEEHAGSRSSDG